jgi:hypothetical protein
VVSKESSDLIVDFGNGLLFFVVRVQNLEKHLVYGGVLRKSILQSLLLEIFCANWLSPHFRKPTDKEKEKKEEQKQK